MEMCMMRKPTANVHLDGNELRIVDFGLRIGDAVIRNPQSEIRNSLHRHRCPDVGMRVVGVQPEVLVAEVEDRADRRVEAYGGQRPGLA